MSSPPFLIKKKRKRRPIVEVKIKGKSVLVKSEFTVQSSYFDWLEWERPIARQYCFAIPNGGSRHPAEAINLKRQGVTRDIPDVFHSIPSNGYHGLYIEFKRVDKRKLSDGQEKKFKLFTEIGYRCELCATLEEAKHVFDEYIGDTLKRFKVNLTV